ncbi:MAG: HIT family protein [Acutalibacteraceae bacterium]
MNCDMCKVIEQIKKGENPWFVREMETGYVILGWNQHFYGYSLFICKQHVVELFDLEPDFRTKYMQEMIVVAQAVKNAFDADKINYECLGNGDVHLHWHIFPRKSGDLGDYGNNGKGPVWWLPKEIMWSQDNIPSSSELQEMKNKLKIQLDIILN